MELLIHELGNYLLVLSIIISPSNASNGKIFLFFVTLKRHFSCSLFFLRIFITTPFLFCFISLQFKSLMLVVKLSVEAQIEEWRTPNSRLTNFPTSISPTLVRIMFSKAASVGLLVSTYRHVSPLTWLHSPIL